MQFAALQRNGIPDLLINKLKKKIVRDDPPSLPMMSAKLQIKIANSVTLILSLFLIAQRNVWANRVAIVFRSRNVLGHDLFQVTILFQQK